jgi:hypothetical protein
MNFVLDLTTRIDMATDAVMHHQHCSNRRLAGAL